MAKRATNEEREMYGDFASEFHYCWFCQHRRTRPVIDELHIAISPVLLGQGEALFAGLDLRALGYACVQFVASEKATHVVLRRQGAEGARA